MQLAQGLVGNGAQLSTTGGGEWGGSGRGAVGAGAVAITSNMFGKEVRVPE